MITIKSGGNKTMIPTTAKELAGLPQLIIKEPLGLESILGWMGTTLVSSLGLLAFSILIILGVLAIGLWGLKKGRIMMLKYEQAWNEPRAALLEKINKQRKKGNPIINFIQWHAAAQAKKTVISEKKTKKTVGEVSEEKSQIIIPPGTFASVGKAFSNLSKALSGEEKGK